MRLISRFAGASLLAFGLAAPALAVSMQGSTPDPTCRAYATAAADSWARDMIQPAGAFEQAGSGKVLVIAAGKKYLMPARQADDRSLAPLPAGQRIAQYQAVKQEEFDHCMFGLPVNYDTLK